MEQIDINTVSPIDTPQKSFPLLPTLLIAALVVGSVSGVLLARFTTTSSQAHSSAQALPNDQGSIKVGTVYGSSDETIFSEKAEGIVVAGGIGGEGSHHLVRVGGVSQNVYISSSVIDLDTVIGARVQVWGQTMGAKKAGWLMDVGRLKVLELNAPMPE